MPLAIPFGASNSSLQGLAPNAKPAPAGPAEQAGQPTLLPGRRSASGLTLPRAPGTLAPSPTSVGFKAVVRTTRGGPVPRPLLPLSDNHIRNPLRLSEFEKELQLYPDKAWSSRLLQAIKCGVSLGFIGPHTPHLSRNLASATKHPDVICAELEKEVTSGRVLGPFEHIPMETFRSSGLGAIPKKGPG